jgi:hypothetical protein
MDFAISVANKLLIYPKSTGFGEEMMVLLDTSPETEI